jgi:hypothetical protein
VNGAVSSQASGYDLAVKLCDNLEYKAAELVLHDHLKNDRQDHLAIGLIADVYEKINRPDLAIDHYKTAIMLGQAKNEDVSDLELSLERLSKDEQSGLPAPGAEKSDTPSEPADNLGGSIKISRRIFPYLGFCEIGDGRRTTNEYGYIINEGMKGETLPYVPDEPKNEFVVGIFGGSIASAFYQDAATTLAENLSHHDKIDGRQVTVLNFAMGGQKQPEQMISLAYFTAMGQHFDLVIQIDGLNDLAGCAGNLHKGYHMAMPPADITEAFMALTAVPDLERQSIKYFNSLSRLESWAARIGSSNIMPGRKGILNWLEKKRRALINNKPQTDAEQNLIRVQRVEPAKMTGMGDDDFRRYVEEISQFWLNCSRNMMAICRERGINFIHSQHPTHFLNGTELGPHDSALASSEPAIEWYKRIVSEGFPNISAKLEDLSHSWEYAHYCNLQNALAGMEDDMLSDRMGHFHSKVHHKMAETISEFFMNQPLFTR